MALTIDEKLYTLEKRKEYQAELNNSYQGIEPLKGGRYPLSLGVEAACIAEGFAYLKYIVLTEDLKWGSLSRVLDDHFGKENYRLLQQCIPKRKSNEENKSPSAFAIYLRYMPDESKLVHEKPAEKPPEKKKLLIKPEAGVQSSTPSLGKVAI